MKQENATSLSGLRTLIGKAVRYCGEPYTVVEVLEEGPSLVLESKQGVTSIQQDSYGRPRRMAQEPIVLRLPATFLTDGQLPEGFEIL